MKLSTQTKYCCIVLRDNKQCPSIERVKEWCVINCDEYSFILHDKDVNLEGECVPKHIHIVCTLKKVQRLSTTLISLSDFLSFHSCAIQIEKPTSYEGCIQYLVHKNDKNKFQYDINKIVSNIPIDELTSIIDSETSTMTFEYVYKICIKARFISDVIRELGLQRFNLYKNTIMLIWSDCEKIKGSFCLTDDEVKPKFESPLIPRKVVDYE